jgi:hypothetical protein
MSDVLSRYPRPHPDSAGRVLDGEAVVVTPADGKMHTLNEVGTWIWERADGARSGADLVESLVEDFDIDEETARADVVAFLEALVEKGVLELSDAPSDPAPPHR